MLNKYLTIFHLSLSQFFIYRLNFTLWRVRNVLQLLFTYFLWTSLFTSKPFIFTYTEQKMISYILLINVTSALILSSRTSELAGDILDGKIMNYLLKPISFFTYIASKECADKALNLLFVIIEVSTLMYIFKPPLFLQTSPSVYFFVFLSLVLGVVLSFFISFCISLIAFWSNEVWAPRFIYIVLISILAGSLFPLDILPPLLYYTLLLTPFPYLIYLPTKIYLEGISPSLTPLIFMSVLWTAILFFITTYIWKKGLREFSFFGR